MVKIKNGNRLVEAYIEHPNNLKMHVRIYSIGQKCK